MTFTTAKQSNSKAYARKVVHEIVLAALLKLDQFKYNPTQIPAGISDFNQDLADFLPGLPA